MSTKFRYLFVFVGHHGFRRRVARRCWLNKAAPRPAAGQVPEIAGERHLRNIKQLTFGGENAEAYFSFDGQPAELPVDQRIATATRSTR